MSYSWGLSPWPLIKSVSLSIMFGKYTAKAHFASKKSMRWFIPRPVEEPLRQSKSKSKPCVGALGATSDKEAKFNAKNSSEDESSLWLLGSDLYVHLRQQRRSSWLWERDIFSLAQIMKSCFFCISPRHLGFPYLLLRQFSQWQIRKGSKFLINQCIKG